VSIDRNSLGLKDDALIDGDSLEPTGLAGACADKFKSAIDDKLKLLKKGN
jgi:hypothetical protein